MILTQHNIQMERDKRETEEGYKKLENNFYDQKQINKDLKAENQTLKKINDFALSMYEPLHCNEMVECTSHIDELEDEFFKAPRIEL